MGNSTNYDVDSNGNGTNDIEQARDHSLGNEMDEGDEWIDPKHDLAGNMISGPKPGAETTTASRQFYVYDCWNRLVMVYKDDGSV